MHASVRDLRDLPLLYVVKGEKNVGYRRKDTPEKQDKIIQFIWDYQDKHDGDTPSASLIGRHVGIDPTGMGYWITMLVDAGRLDRISSKPFRATITDHKDNQRAIERFKRLRARIEAEHAKERDQIRQNQEELRATEQLRDDRSAALSLVSDTVDVEVRPKAEVETRQRPAVGASWQDPDVEKMSRFNSAHAEVKAANRDVKAMMPRLLKIADERDLVFELVSRGYRVDKVR